MDSGSLKDGYCDGLDVNMEDGFFVSNKDGIRDGYLDDFCVGDEDECGDG